MPNNGYGQFGTNVGGGNGFVGGGGFPAQPSTQPL